MQNPVIVVLFVKFKESAFDKKAARRLSAFVYWFVDRDRR